MPLDKNLFAPPEEDLFAPPDGVGDLFAPPEAVDAPISPINELSDSLPASQRGGVILPPVEEPVPARPIDRNRVDEIVNEISFSQAPKQKKPQTVLEWVEEEKRRNDPARIGRQMVERANLLKKSLTRGAGLGGELIGRGAELLSEKLPDVEAFGGFSADPTFATTLPDQPPVNIQKDFEAMGTAVREAGKKLAEENLTEHHLKEFEWSDLGTPEFYLSKGAQSLPLIFPIMGAGVAVGTGASALATATGIGALGATAIGAISSAIASRPLESAMEAMGAYNEVIDGGGTPEQASQVASETFNKNLGLGALDAVQFALAFAKIQKPARKGFVSYLQRVASTRTARGAGFVVGAGSEGGEEYTQGYIVEQAKATAFGNPDVEFLKSLDEMTPEQREQFALGVTMGALFQTGGVASGSMSKQEVDNVINEILSDYNLSPDVQKDAGQFAPDVDPEQAGLKPKTPLERARILTGERMSQQAEAQTGQELEQRPGQQEIEFARQAQKEYEPTRDTTEISRRIIEDHYADPESRGSTFTPDGINLAGKPYYSVATPLKVKEDVQGEITEAQVQDFIDRNKETLAKSDILSIGTWEYKTDDGEVRTEIAISLAIKDARIAKALGKKYDQKAIFNLEDMSEINTRGKDKYVGELTVEDILIDYRKLNNGKLPYKLQHYSTGEYSTLSPSMSEETGTTGKTGGLETRRKQVPGIHYYLPGSVVETEQGFGKAGTYVYDVEADLKMFDKDYMTNEEKQVVRDKAKELQGDDPNYAYYFEQALTELGYDGYVNRGVGAVKVFSDIEVTPKRIGEDGRAVAVEGDVEVDSGADAQNAGDIFGLPFDVAETQVKEPFVGKLKDLHSAVREIDGVISKIEGRIVEGEDPSLFEASQAELAELSQLRADIVNEINSLPRRGKMEPIEFQEPEQADEFEIPESGKTVRSEQPAKEVVGRDIELIEKIERLTELSEKTKNMRLRAGIQSQIDLAQEELNQMVELDPQDSFMGMDESVPIEERIDDMPPPPEETYKQEPQPITQSDKTRKAVSGRRRRATARYKSAKKGLDKTLTPISTRLKNIHPELKAGLRRFEANMLQKVREDGQKIRGWVDGVRKMSKEDHRIADLAMKNSDIEMLNELAGKYGLEEELQSVRGVLDELYRAGREVGFDTRYIESYFPRQVIDYKGFLEHLEQSADADILQEAYDERAKKLGKSTLTDEEKVSVANGLIRGYGAGLKTGTPRNLKGRSIQTVDEDLNQFYMSSNDALIQYVSELNETIEGRKWLGIKPKDGASKDIDEETIGAFVKDLHDRGLIDGSQQQEVIDLIGARFSRNTMNAYLQRSKNFGYLVAMGSPVNAVTQLGDLAWSIYMGGIPRTALEGARSIVGASKTTKEDVGIEHLAHEMASEDGVANLVDKTFKATGLTKIDGIGKEALMNSTFNKITKQVNSGKIDGKINDLLEQMFPDPNELQSIKEDIQNGTLSEQDEKYMKFFTLAEFQPISKSEMPENYLRHPNGRALYMLKTYTIKQFDVMRNQAIHTIKNGKTAKDKARGMKQLVELASIIMMSNAGADMLKDFILGRETPIDDIVADNLLLLIGSNKYQADQLERKGLGKTALESVAPPMSINNPLWWDISRDTKDLIEGGVDGVEDIRTIRRVPVVGKIISSRFGYDKKVREMFEPKKKNKISPRKYSRERDTRKTKR